MKNTMMVMNEKELDIVNGGWSVDVAKNIINTCAKSEDLSCVYDGIKVQLKFSTKVPVVGDMMDNLIAIVGSGECAKFTSGGGKGLLIQKIGPVEREISATFEKV